MTRSVCNTCFSVFHLFIEMEDVELVRQVADVEGQTCPCPRLCGGRINVVFDGALSTLTKDPRLRPASTLTAKQLYAALGGLGLPDEVPLSSETVEALLRAYPVVSAQVEEFQGSMYLHELKLDNGVTLHLGAGTKGAQVLKMTKEMKHGLCRSS